MNGLVKKIKGQFKEENRYENFPNFITQINFPYYKGLVEKTRIDFNFPITVLVGQNGCGKSSVLHALETTPAGKSYSPKWFTTAVDPIKDSSSGQKPCYWYKYFNKDAGQIVEVLNTRIKSQKNLDYWEPSRPILKHGMQPMPSLIEGKSLSGRVKTRWNGVDRSVEYIDFRSELSAFDKYFYFENPPRKKLYSTKQEYIRFFSRYLKRVFLGSLSSYILRNIERVRSRVNLEEKELTIISRILGKQYDSATIVEHSFYKNTGTSVFFNTPGLGYSEAFAGSGEMSVVKLVHRVFNATSGSLILLDEPEVSLHPGAQSKLIEFLLKQVSDKGHQIVISTHSPAIVQCLPKEAITVLKQNGEGQFNAINGVAPELAFQHIGHQSNSKVRIIVEDDAACQLLEKILITEWPKSEKLVEIIFHGGGAKNIFEEALVLSRLDANKTHIYLDGDQFKKEILDDRDLGDSKLDKMISDVTGIGIKSFRFCADSGNTEQIIKEQRKYLKYLKSHCHFLPGNDPEDTIWKASKVPDRGEFKDPCYKKRIKCWVERDIGEGNCNASDIQTYRKKLLNNYDKKNLNIVDIKKKLKLILNL